MYKELNIQELEQAEQSRAKAKKKFTLGSLFYSLIFLILVALMIMMIMLGRKLPVPYMLFVVESGSMQPTIKTGDIIAIKKQQNYKVGDVITFNSGYGTDKRIITHRIVEADKEGTEFRTKGDYNSVIDVDKVNKKDILGKYVYRVPLVGYPISYTRTVQGAVLLIIIPSLLIILDQFYKIKNELFKRKNISETI